METNEALKQLGFVSDADDGESLVYDFGNFELKAFQSMNRLFVTVIYVTGVYYDRRTLCDVEIQLPLHVASIELCAAFIASGIERSVGKNFTPLIPTDWLEMGRENYDLLPWVIAQKRRSEEEKIYKQRPKCLVEREWLKLAIRELRVIVGQLNENDLFIVTFQNGIFSLRSRLKLVAFPAIGNDWQEEYELSVKDFNQFPKRINYQETEVSIWEGNLIIEHWRYPLNKNESISINE